MIADTNHLEMYKIITSYLTNAKIYLRDVSNTD